MNMSCDLLIRGGAIALQSGQLSAGIAAVKEMGVLTGHRSAVRLARRASLIISATTS
jgi:hypothetical protein